MAREKELFRLNLERLDKAFPNKEYLTSRDICDFTGLERHTVRKKFKYDGKLISKVSLANQMS